MVEVFDNKIVGRNIAKLRIHKGVKAIEIAKKLSISEAAYTKYERGETSITLNFLNEIANFFSISPYQLLRNQPENIIENIFFSTLSINTNTYVTKEVISALINQLKVKDSQIEVLLKKIRTS